MAGGADEQGLLRAVGHLGRPGRLRELGPVRHSLTEIFREALAAPDAAAGGTTTKTATTGQEA